MVALNGKRDALAKGTMRGQYRVDGIIGSGGDALIYCATDKHSTERCVLKEFFPLTCAHRDEHGAIRPSDPGLARDFDLALEAFEQETEILTKISHPNLIGCKGRATMSAGSYIILDHEIGVTLEHLFTQTNWNRSALYWWHALQGIISALRSLHRAGFLHGDISARNIIMRPDNSLVLLDLGSALPLLSQQTIRSVTRVNCAIELIVQNRPAGISADIFAIASILYQALSGYECPSATKRLDGAGFVHLARCANTDFEHKFYSAIDAALAISPEKRPQSVGAFLEGVPLQFHPGLLPDHAALSPSFLAETPERPTRIRSWKTPS